MTRKEAFEKAEKEYRQAILEVKLASKELSAVKSMHKSALEKENAAWLAYARFVGVNKVTDDYIQHITKLGLN